MGPAYHRGVPLLGVPENPIDGQKKLFQIYLEEKNCQAKIASWSRCIQNSFFGDRGALIRKQSKLSKAWNEVASKIDRRLCFHPPDNVRIDKGIPHDGSFGTGGERWDTQ